MQGSRHLRCNERLPLLRPGTATHHVVRAHPLARSCYNTCPAAGRVRTLVLSLDILGFLLHVYFYLSPPRTGLGFLLQILYYRDSYTRISCGSPSSNGVCVPSFGLDTYRLTNTTAPLGFVCASIYLSIYLSPPRIFRGQTHLLWGLREALRA